MFGVFSYEARNAVNKRDFYTTRLENDEPDFDCIEDMAGKVEDVAAPAIGFILQHKRGLKNISWSVDRNPPISYPA